MLFKLLGVLFFGILLPVIFRFCQNFLYFFINRKINNKLPEKTSNNLSKAEAYAILGVSEDDNDEQIEKKYKNLMRRLHPDQGGSNYLATRLNQAYQLLSKKHNNRK